MDTKIIKAILNDWNSNKLTHGQIKEKYQITKNQDYAITLCSRGLTIKQIQERIKGVKSDMKALQIEQVMKG